MHKTKG